MRIVIVGGGASAIAAAITAAKVNKDADITILEKLDRVGKKILSTGNGRCNLTNCDINADFYHSSDKRFADKFISKMPYEMSIDFFNDLGLYCTADEAGRVYPLSKQATMVLDVLLINLKRNNINVVCNTAVTGIKKDKNIYKVVTEEGKVYKADKIIISTGGMAAPKQGSTGDGYKILSSIGHKTTKLLPSLVAFKCANPSLKGLKGIRVNGTATLYSNGKKMASDTGEIQLTDYGLSGIPLMQLSCYLRGNEKNLSIGVDFMPEMKFDEIVELFSSRVKLYPNESLEDIFSGLIPKKIIYALMRENGITNLSSNASVLSAANIKNLASSIKDWRLPVIDTLSWDNAQVTGGGILLNEINDDFSSVYDKNVYIVGEILDICGMCGGYNLHWAWCSGIIAGESVAKQ